MNQWQKNRPNFIYVIQAENGLIKIGRSRTPEDRMRAVNRHSPIPARLIAKWEGRIQDEALLHRKFARHRSHGEWFRPEAEVAEFISQVTGHGLIAPIAEWFTLTVAGRQERQKQAMALTSAKMKALWSDPERKKHWVGQLALGRQKRAERQAA